MGHPDYEVTGGSAAYKGTDLFELEPEQRSHMGLFLRCVAAWQGPASWRQGSLVGTQAHVRYVHLVALRYFPNLGAPCGLRIALRFVVLPFASLHPAAAFSRQWRSRASPTSTSCG